MRREVILDHAVGYFRFLGIKNFPRPDHGRADQRRHNCPFNKCHRFLFLNTLPASEGYGPSQNYLVCRAVANAPTVLNFSSAPPSSRRALRQ